MAMHSDMCTWCTWLTLATLATSSSSLSMEESTPSFLWSVRSPWSSKPSYLFGTVHAAHTALWDAVPMQAKQAIHEADHLVLELDLTDESMSHSLGSCALLPRRESLQSVLPSDLYARLESQMAAMASDVGNWLDDQSPLQLFSHSLYQRLTLNWRQRKPMAMLFLLSMLTPTYMLHCTVAILDVYLAQLMRKLGKRVSSIESVEEQCRIFDAFSRQEQLFTLNITLRDMEERRRLGLRPLDHLASLIEQYRQLDLDADMLWDGGFMFLNVTFSPDEKRMADQVKQTMKDNLLLKRDTIMVDRMVDMLNSSRSTSFLFAFGALHFIGEPGIPQRLRQRGFQVENVLVAKPEPIHKHDDSDESVVQGTFDDLSLEQRRKVLQQFVSIRQKDMERQQTRGFLDENDSTQILISSAGSQLQQLHKHDERPMREENSRSEETRPANTAPNLLKDCYTASLISMVSMTIVQNIFAQLQYTN